MSDINEVLERLEQQITSGNEVPVTRATVNAADIRALLDDHARLQADAAKRATGQPLCDLCQQREEVRSDAEGIGFCQACWDGWQADEAKTVQP